MLLKNHIATRFLDPSDDLVMEMVESTHPDIWEQAIKKDSNLDDLPHEFRDTYNFFCSRESKNYIVTNSVLDLLDHLKVAKNGVYDWTVFKNIKYGKYTFIMPGNKLLRFFSSEKTLSFMHLEENGRTGNTAQIAWCMWYFHRDTGEPCPHYTSNDVQTVTPFVFALLCFIFLSKNEEIEIKPGAKHGTKKSGKIINTLSSSVTIINSRWNITAIRNEGFGVSGHFRLQRCGKNWEDTEVIFIDPFEKKGYIRRAKSETVKS